MTDNQIACFLKVANKKSFSQAAMELYVSQSAVSKHIAALETELKAPLFDRTFSPIKLTLAGELFLQYCLGAEQNKTLMMKQIRELDNSMYKTVRFGCRNTYDVSKFYDLLLESISIKYPNVKLEIVGYLPGGPMPMLNDGKIDIAMVYDIEPMYYNKVLFLPFFKLNFGLMYWADDPKIHTPVSIMDFLEKDFVTLNTPNGKILQGYFKRECVPYETTIKFHEAYSLSNALIEVLLGKSVVLVDELEMCQTNSKFKFFPLNRSLSTRLIHLAKEDPSTKDFFIHDVAECFSNAISEYVL